MKKELFEELAQIKASIKSLQEKEKSVQGKIIFSMKEEEVDKVRLPEKGLYSLVTTTRWQYQDSVKKEVKEIQEKAKTTGLADTVESESLRFTPIKL